MAKIGGWRGRRRGEMKRNLIDMGQEGREKYFKCSFFEEIPSKDVSQRLQNTIGKPYVSNGEI